MWGIIKGFKLSDAQQEWDIVAVRKMVAEKNVELYKVKKKKI